MAEWSVRDVDACWDAYTARAGGAGGDRQLRRAGPPRPDQGGGPRARRARRVVGPHGRGGGVVGHGGGALLVGLAQAGGGAVPRPGAARALRGPRRAAHHGLGRPPSRPRGPPGRRPARAAGVGRASASCRATGAAPPTRWRCPAPAPAPGTGAVGLMPTPAELAQSHTDLKPEELEHLQRLLGSWSVLADLSFSDLLLLVPVHTTSPTGDDGSDPGAWWPRRTPSWSCSGRCAPTTAPRWSTRTSSARPSTSPSGRWSRSACTRARSCAAASTTRSWASRSRWRTSPSASRAGSSPPCCGSRWRRSRVRRPCTSGPTSTCSSAWPTWWPSRPSPSPTRTSAPRRRRGSATASWWSTPTAGWSSPRPTP